MGCVCGRRWEHSPLTENMLLRRVANRPKGALMKSCGGRKNGGIRANHLRATERKEGYEAEL